MVSSSSPQEDKSPASRKTLQQRQGMSDIERLRHSTAHVMATAVLRLWPDAQLAAGPPIDNGFYYDMALDHAITPEDFQKIEEEMRLVVKENQLFEREEISRKQAHKLIEEGRLGALAQRSSESVFKKELLEDIPEGEAISLFKNGEFWDLCAGPHVARTGNCKAFKIMSVASAFFKGDSSRPQLQRLYGTAFKNKTLLADYLEKLEEAKKRDHRKLGRSLGIFEIDEAVGQGLILWKPKGAIIRRALQDFITEELDAQGYSQVFTPHIGKLDLYRTSGHFPYYKESQYPAIAERGVLEKLNEEGASCASLSNGLENGLFEGYLLKPMNCPHHIKIFASDHHSYRDLPVRLAEFGTVYRWEQSGELGGMTRVRGFTQDDAHIFCTPDQVEEEIASCLALVKTVLSVLGIHDYRVRLSLRDPDSDKYVGSSENWERAENALRRCVEVMGVDYSCELGEAAFYGPKIDFVVKDVLERDWQLGTVQVDYNLPERFGLSYVGEDNAAHRPVMIHRAPFGSLERFVGLLIEHFEGKFPTWLNPCQVRILPISDKFLEPALALSQRYAREGIRVACDERSEKIGAKIRDARLDRVAYMLVLGSKEVEDASVSVRHRDKGDLGSMSQDIFLQRIKEEIAKRQLIP